MNDPETLQALIQWGLSFVVALAIGMARPMGVAVIFPGFTRFQLLGLLRTVVVMMARLSYFALSNMPDNFANEAFYLAMHGRDQSSAAKLLLDVTLEMAKVGEREEVAQVRDLAELPQ